jgi:hypothetical protein
MGVAARRGCRQYADVGMPGGSGGDRSQVDFSLCVSILREVRAMSVTQLGMSKRCSAYMPSEGCRREREDIAAAFDVAAVTQSRPWFRRA